MILTCSFPCLLRDLTHDESVGYDDHRQRHHIHGSHVEQVVSQFVIFAGEKVEGDTLGEPLELWVSLKVENHTLKVNKTSNGY